MSTQSRTAIVTGASKGIGAALAKQLASDGSIGELARAAGMSAPTFHRHFRTVTTMSPLQFQKQIRLQEARRRLLSGKANAASVGFDVGYESPSQFSREYHRMFGAPPVRDVVRQKRKWSSAVPEAKRSANMAGVLNAAP